MNTKYLLYALVVTAIATVMSWASMIDSSSTSRGRGSTWSSGSGGYYGGGGGGYSGGGHK